MARSHSNKPSNKPNPTNTGTACSVRRQLLGRYALLHVEPTGEDMFANPTALQGDLAVSLSNVAAPVAVNGVATAGEISGKSDVIS